MAHNIPPLITLGDSTLHLTCPEDKIKELTRIIYEKEDEYRQLQDKVAKQEKQIVALIEQYDVTITQKVPYNLYKQFLNGQSQLYLSVKVAAETIQKRLPIWLSKNIQIANYEIESKTKKREDWKWVEAAVQVEDIDEEAAFQSKLAIEVVQLKENLGKYEQIIENLKEMKELDYLEKQQQAESLLSTPIRRLQKVSDPQPNSKIIDLEQKMHILQQQNIKIVKRFDALNQKSDISHLQSKQPQKQLISNGRKPHRKRIYKYVIN